MTVSHIATATADGDSEFNGSATESNSVPVNDSHALSLTKSVLQSVPPPGLPGSPDSSPVTAGVTGGQETADAVRKHFEGEQYNILMLGPLTRQHLKMLLTCEAANNNLTIPTSVVVMIDMNCEYKRIILNSTKCYNTQTSYIKYNKDLY